VNGYVAAGYGVAFGTLVLYSWRVLWRGRLLRRALASREPERTQT
jgi:hypothetical protein